MGKQDNAKRSASLLIPSSEGFSMLSPMHLRLDPWATEYNTAYHAEQQAPQKDDEKEAFSIDITVEGVTWEARNPDPHAISSVPWRRLLFSDGSRRIEARVLLESTDGTKHAFGALGSYGVGAVDCCAQQPAQRKATFVNLADIGIGNNITRVCLLSDKQTLPPLEIACPTGDYGILHYQVISCEEEDVDAVIRKLQQAMLNAERSLTKALLNHYDDALIIRDGPHPRKEMQDSKEAKGIQGIARMREVVGYVKTIHELRLEPEELEMIRSLRQGQRSPLYLVKDNYSVPYFECFLRLRDPSPWLYSLAGMVRLQFFAGHNPEKLLDAAIMRADWLSLHLPRYASLQYQDPRAPQQLLPVRALESELRRLMGHPKIVRRRIMAHLRGQP